MPGRDEFRRTAAALQSKAAESVMTVLQLRVTQGGRVECIVFC